MKTKLFFIVSLFLISFGCKEEKKIEIIQTDQVYHQLNEVDVLPEIMTDSSGRIEKMVRDKFNKVKEVFNTLKENEKEVFKVDYRLLVNEVGKVDKIQIIKSKYPPIDKIIVEIANNLNFIPAKKDGKKVKCVFPWVYDYSIFSTQNLNEPGKDSGQNTYFVAVEEMPEPVGGMKSIQEKILYPEIAKRAGIEGKVYVLAFIDENGNVVSAKILKGIGAGCDEAALNAVKETKFTPGKQRGKPVKTQVSIPIMFKLQ